MRKVFRRMWYRIKFFHFHALHFRSRRAIESWQLKRLSKLIAHARKNVPLYRALHAEQRIGIRTFADLGKIPIVTKESFLGEPFEYYTDISKPPRGSWANTSGTSGKPFTVLRRREIYMPLYADSLRYRFFWEKSWKFDISGLKIARVKVRSSSGPNRLFISIKDYLSDEEKALSRLVEFKPNIIEGYASILYEIAKGVEARGLVLRPRYVISGGEQISSAVRKYISDVLQCEVFDRYALEEVGAVASECSAHNGLHINCESLVVEVVNEKGNILSEGESGRIIVTDLFNYSMPFIRYDTGDHGVLTWDKCACGLNAPRLWLEGRYSAFLDFAARRIHHLEFDAALDMFMHAIAQYQVVKHADNRVAVRIVPGAQFDDKVKARIIQNIQDLVGPQVTVTLEPVSAIPRTPRGKSQIVADESRG